MYIDTHVHCRDEQQFDKETISHALIVAERASVDAIFDMPNVANPVTTRARVVDRLGIAEKAHSKVFYGTYVGLTSDSEQIREAVSAHKEFFPRVVGLKLFAGRSVGDLAVIDEKDQEKIYRGLKGYPGVLAVHCEKEFLLKPEIWDSLNPITHCWARPPEAALASVEDQVRFAWNACFEGTLHIAHVSTPEEVDYIDEIRRNLGSNEISRLKISCGATPHHLFLSEEMMNNKNGLLFKVNPPLRTYIQQKALFDRLRERKIDFIETDHAPHILEEKLGEPYLSGMPGLDKWPRIYQRLKADGFSERLIEDLVFNNAFKTFNIPPGIIRRTIDSEDLQLKEYSSGYIL